MKFVLLILLFATVLNLESILIEFVVTDFPKDPADPDIYIAGDFNNWDPGAKDFRLTKEANGYKITLDIEKGRKIEYKFTMGSWEKVEKGKDYEEISNRSAEIKKDNKILKHKILNWCNASKDKNMKKSTVTGNVIHIRDFYMPQLDRKRDLRIYLPPDYDTSDKRYPVIYMQDGQNLFDEATSFAGEWQIDETMERFYKEAKINGAIVVGIDNHPLKRADEYSPWVNDNYRKDTGGEGDLYTTFIVETLIPWVNENYRTLPQKENTMIAGSSLGGLISVYAGCKYPGVFGKLGIFSPAFWFADPHIKDYIKSHPIMPSAKVYMDVGTKEGSDKEMQKAYLNDAKEIFQVLQDSGLPSEHIRFVIDEGARHHEGSWAKRFPDAILWLNEQ